MTISEAIAKKVQALTILREGLLKKLKFLNPENDSVVYSSKEMNELSGTMGITPNNVAEVLGVAMEKISAHLDELRKYPFSEGSAIGQEKMPFIIMPHSAIASTDKSIRNVGVSTFYDSIHSARVEDGIRRISIAVTYPRHNDGDFELYIAKVNTRLNVFSMFQIDENGYFMDFSAASINIDDIFVCGVRTNKNLPGSVMSLNGYITVNVVTVSGDTTDKFYMSGNRVETFIESSRLIEGSSFLWSVISINGNIPELIDSSKRTIVARKDTSINIDIPYGAKIEKFMQSGNPIHVGLLKLSNSTNTGFFRDTDSIRYDVGKNKNDTGTAIMRNATNVNAIIEDVIDGI